MKDRITPEELQALPENGGFDTVEKIRDGKKIRSYSMKPAFVLSDTGIVKDNEGSVWLVGYHDGTRYKSRLKKTSFDAIKKGRHFH